MRRVLASGVRIIGKPGTKPFIGFGRIAPLSQPFIHLSRLQERSGLPPGSIIKQVDLEKLGKGLVQSILMKIGFATQEMSLRGEVASVASIDHRLEGGTGVVRACQPEQGPAAGKIEIGDGRISAGKSPT